jgi:hypothetical protein
MLFSFVGLEGSSVCPRFMQDYVPRWWIGESRVVRDAYMFILEIHTSSFGAGQPVGRNGAAFLSAMLHRENFHSLGIQDVAEFDFN